MTWKNFTREEFACQCGCGTNEIKDEAIDLAQEVRDIVGFPMKITSGYRCPIHPIEAKKKKPGSHARGLAWDVGCSHAQSREITKTLLILNKGGVGVHQRGKGRFVHGDVAEDRIDLFWTY